MTRGRPSWKLIVAAGAQALQAAGYREAATANEQAERMCEHR